MRAEANRRAELVGLTQVLVVEGAKVMRAFAHRHGLHPTDVEALTWVKLAHDEERPVTAGMLGEHLGLTSGAVTAVLDRLERAGHVRRARDPADRRRVVLAYSPAGLALAEDFFGPLLGGADAVMDGFTHEELDVVRRYLAATGADMAEQRRRLAGDSHALDEEAHRSSTSEEL